MDIAAQFDMTPAQQKSFANGIDIIYSEGANMMKEKATQIFNELIVELEENPDMTIDEAMTVFQERINKQEATNKTKRKTR